VLVNPVNRTPDMGGRCRTGDIGDLICKQLVSL